MGNNMRCRRFWRFMIIVSVCSSVGCIVSNGSLTLDLHTPCWTPQDLRGCEGSVMALVSSSHDFSDYRFQSGVTTRASDWKEWVPTRRNFGYDTVLKISSHYHYDDVRIAFAIFRQAFKICSSSSAPSVKTLSVSPRTMAAVDLAFVFNRGLRMIRSCN